MKTLDNLYIAVTRPAHQADRICAIIEQEGGHAVRWPLLAIEPITLSDKTRSALSQLDQYDRIIFVSANAVTFGAQAFQQCHLDQSDWSAQLNTMPVYAVGKATAQALAKEGITNAETPDHASTEGLLAMTDFSDQKLQDQQILIVRGEGGRETLAESLQERGVAKLDYAEVYTRQTAPSDPQQLLDHWQAEKLDIIMVTSCAALDNLSKKLNEIAAKTLFNCPLLVVSQRIADHAKTLGYGSVLIAASANDNDVINTMQTWHQTRNHS